MLNEQLPFNHEYNCATQINSTHGIIMGGFGSDLKETLIVNLNDFDMITGPTLQKSRYGHSCARISAANGTDYVIVVGGSYYPYSSEILVGNNWKDGMCELGGHTQTMWAIYCTFLPLSNFPHLWMVLFFRLCGHFTIPTPPHNHIVCVK